MESSRSSTQKMTIISSNIVETILYIPFLESSEITIDLLVQMTVVHNFLRILDSTFFKATVHSSNGIKTFF